MERGVMKEGRRETGCGGDKGDLKPIANQLQVVTDALLRMMTRVPSSDN